MIIGIPRALEYYRSAVLWQAYFDALEIKTIVSGESTQKTLALGSANSIDESCLASKLFLGHVGELLDCCDRIFVPRIDSYTKNDQACVKFNALFDIVNCTFPSARLVEINIDQPKGYGEQNAYIDLAVRLDKTRRQGRLAIQQALEADRLERKAVHQRLLEEVGKVDKQRILIASHAYNSCDKLIGQPIAAILERLGARVVFSHHFDRVKAYQYYKGLSRSLYWTHGKELVGAIEALKDSVDGIVFVSSFPCGADSIIADLVGRRIGIPYSVLIVDEHQSQVGLLTRLESFVDILATKRAI